MKRVLIMVMLSFTLLLSACQQEENTDTLVVGIECAYAPFDWTIGEANEHTVQLDGSSLYCDGYDVDIATHVANELGVELVVKKIEWTGLIPALQSGVIDLIISAMSPTEERSESVLFSDEYYRVNTVLIVKNDGGYENATSLSDFDGANVIAQQTTIQDGLIDQIPNVNHMLPLAHTSELVISLTSGVSDAVVTEQPVARAIVSANPSLTYIELPENSGFTVDDSLVTIAAAARLGEQNLIDRINEALSLLTLEDRELLMDQASNRQPSDD